MFSTALVAEEQDLTESELKVVVELQRAINKKDVQCVINMLNGIKDERRLPLIVNHSSRGATIVEQAADRFKSTISKYQQGTGKVSDTDGFRADINKIGLIYELVIYAANEHPPRKYGHK